VLFNKILTICRVDSVEKFREKLPSLRAELKDDRMFLFFCQNLISFVQNLHLVVSSQNVSF
jgi:hypothetical protein